MISIELLLDAETEARIRDDWARLEAAGLSSLGAHTSPSNRPHITLLVRPALGDLTFVQVVRRLPVTVRLDAPVVFEHGDRGVLAWRVAVSDELREIHHMLHQAAGPGADAAHTVPGEWTPHVTLARRLQLAALPEALASIGSPPDGAVVALRRWDSVTRTVTSLELT